MSVRHFTISQNHQNSYNSLDSNNNFLALLLFFVIIIKSQRLHNDFTFYSKLQPLGHSSLFATS